MRRRSVAGRVFGGFTSTLVRLAELVLFCAIWRFLLHGAVRMINFIAEHAESPVRIHLSPDPTTWLQIAGWIVIAIFVFKYR